MKKQNKTPQFPVFSDSVFRILAEKSPNMIFINQNGRVIFANDKCEEIMGYKRNEFYSEDFDFTALIHPESRYLVKDNFMKHMRGEEVAPYEYKIITKDARELTAIHTTKLIEHEGEKAVLGIITDITARKQAEEAVLRIAETVSATSDRNFFYSVAEELVGLLKSDYAYVAEVLPDSPDRARTLSLIADGKVIDNVEVVLSGTPCSTLSGRKTCSYPSNVQELFPDAPMMAKLKVQGYAGTALFNSSGTQLGLMAVMFRNPMRNVTMAESILQIFGAYVSAELERKQTEKQIMRSKKEFEILMENALVGIFKANLKGDILLSNRTLLNMFDFTSPDEMTTLPVFTDRKFRKHRNEIIKKLKQTGKVVNFELNAVTHNGRSINILLNATFENNIISGMMLDITKRKTAENALMTSERKFRTLYNQASDSIFLLSLSRSGLIIEDVNNAAALTHGYTREEMIGKPIAFLDTPETAKHLKERTRLLKKGETLVFEGSHVRKDGSVFPVDVTAQLIHIDEMPYVLAIDRDITERRRAEEKLIKHRAHLEELVKERTHEILDANKNLKIEVSVRKRAEKKLLHYQKQLQLLTSQLSLIEENEKRRIASELHDCIGQTLALSKIKLGLLNKSAPSPEFKSSIKEILSLIEQTIRETRTLTFELSPPILYELGLSQAIKWLIDQFCQKHGLTIELLDDGQEISFDNNTRFFLFQAIRELLVNVVKHAEASRVKIFMTRDNGTLRIVLEDDGIGFPKSPVHHEGYGLFNIRERMNHINGNFKITSIPGRGTRITLEAPIMPDHK